MTVLGLTVNQMDAANPEGQWVMPPANRLGRPCALPRARLGRCMGRIALVRSAQVDRRRGYPAVRLAARRHPP